MRKESASRLDIFTPRVLLAFSCCLTSALLALAAPHAETPLPRTPAAALSPGTITTFTGDGGSSGRATNTAMAPYGGVVRNGYLYLADARWNVVRRIDLVSGEQIVIAGNGLAGNGVEAYNGDNIP